MAEFTKIMEIRKRMCDSFNGCSKCPIHQENNGKKMTCFEFMKNFPQITEQIILKWDEEHPVKTRLADFLEKHPNAKLDEKGFPVSCARYIGYCEGCHTSRSDKCEDCWNTPLED